MLMNIEAAPQSRCPISCCIIAKNEGDRIERTIRAAAGIADEIIVVDSGSTDDTVDVARRAGARVYYRAWDGFGPQKRYAEECATHDWILNLDADEVITPALASEIHRLMASPPALKAYRFRQVTVYPGREKPRLWADAHNYARLYDRRAVRFRDSLVHDIVDLAGHKTGQLRGHALHYSWRTLEHVRAKLDGYAELSAKEIKKSVPEVLVRLPIEYPILFFRYYVLARHFTGGLYGVKVAHTFASGRTKRLTKFLKNRGRLGANG